MSLVPGNREILACPVHRVWLAGRSGDPVNRFIRRFNFLSWSPAHPPDPPFQVGQVVAFRGWDLVDPLTYDPARGPIEQWVIEKIGQTTACLAPIEDL
jgi:hypothetical protein